MAKKKVGGKKKGVKKGKGGKDAAVLPSPQTEVQLVKEYFLLQVHDLESRLHIALTTATEATDKWEKLNSTHTKEMETLTSVIEFHKRENGKLNDIVIGFKEKIVLEERALAAKLKDMTEKTDAQVANMKKQLEKSERDCGIRDKKLSSLDEFRVQEERLLKTVEDLRQQLVDQADGYKASLSVVQKDGDGHKERLRAQLEHRVQSVAMAFQKQTLADMPANSKRMLSENLAMYDQIQGLSVETAVLVDQNLWLRQVNESTKADTTILAIHEQKLSQQCRSQQVQIKDLESQKADLVVALKDQDDRAKQQRIEILCANEEKQRELKQNLVEAEHSYTEQSLILKEVYGSIDTAQRDAKHMRDLQAVAHRRVSSSLESARVTRTSILRLAVAHEENGGGAESATPYMAASDELDQQINVLETLQSILIPPQLPTAAKYENGMLGFVPRPIYTDSSPGTVHGGRSFVGSRPMTAHAVLQSSPSRPSADRTSTPLRRASSAIGSRPNTTPHNVVQSSISMISLPNKPRVLTGTEGSSPYRTQVARPSSALNLVLRPTNATPSASVEDRIGDTRIAAGLRPTSASTFRQIIVPLSAA